MLFFGVKILKFFDEDPGSGMETVRIRDKHPGSATLCPALQNMKFLNFLLLLWVIFALLDLDLDSEYGSGSTDLIESNPDQDLKP